MTGLPQFPTGRTNLRLRPLTLWFSPFSCSRDHVPNKLAVCKSFLSDTPVMTPQVDRMQTFLPFLCPSISPLSSFSIGDLKFTEVVRVKCAKKGEKWFPSSEAAATNAGSTLISTGAMRDLNACEGFHSSLRAAGVLYPKCELDV